MIEFLQECIAPVNLPATILLGLVMLYWVMVILGVLGMDAFDLDLDADLDVDVDIDGFDGDFEGGSMFGDALKFLYLGDVPVMIVASFFAVTMWVVTILSNHYLNPEYSWMVLGLWIIPNIILSLILTKAALMPIATLFRNNDPEQVLGERLIGSIGLVKTSVVNQGFGQIEINQDGPPIVVNVTAPAGKELAKGDAARIVGYDKLKGTYIVELSKWENT